MYTPSLTSSPATKPRVKPHPFTTPISLSKRSPSQASLTSQLTEPLSHILLLLLLILILPHTTSLNLQSYIPPNQTPLPLPKRLPKPRQPPIAKRSPRPNHPSDVQTPTSMSRFTKSVAEQPAPSSSNVLQKTLRRGLQSLRPSACSRQSCETSRHVEKERKKGKGNRGIRALGTSQLPAALGYANARAGTDRLRPKNTR
ncbi:hypothetical protein CCHR01_19431 [Colletotrichum chrysophilum]|uniref:Uncharacterized protein n=1 Tax=Colletotrichum chrysophilum TaxID=1836956 RepID=A0AAD9E7U0_9PEZI|nr:hypothetical protein CCHR01_19431 [Colletotrichum chrysophilum]